MELGYVKLFRQIVDSWVFADEKALKIWLWLLLKANYKAKYISVHSGRGMTTIEIQRGQMVYGRIKAEEELGISGSAIYRILKRLEEQKMIEVESNTQFSIITICKYDIYQNEIIEDETPKKHERNTLEQHSNSERNTKETRTDTTNKEKNVNKGKEGEEGKENTSASNDTGEGETLARRFEAIYQLYPKKTGKIEALKQIRNAYDLLRKHSEHIETFISTIMINATDEQRAAYRNPLTLLERQTKRYAMAMQGKEIKFIPDPERFFKKGKYLESPEVWAQMAEGV